MLPPWPVTVLLWTAGGLVLFALACVTAARHTAHPSVGLGAAACFLLLDPLRGTLELGQVNMVLIGLVALDCLLPRTPWPRGLLVGLAAAVKLTPAVFVLFFLARGRCRAAGTAVASFAALGAVGWAVAPADSACFWFHAMPDPGRVGGLAYTGNQSLRGMLFRLGVGTPVWAVLCLLVLAVTWVVITRTRHDLTAVLAVATAGLLISPVSWSHHWVWIGPALLVLRGGVRVAVGLVFLVGPHWLLPRTGDVELRWQWWQHAVGNSYVWLGVAFLVWLLLRTTGRTAPGTQPCGHRVTRPVRHAQAAISTRLRRPSLPCTDVRCVLTVDSDR
ncbi:hypothetical protein ALI22I_05215 [Saccharothrix sp. ALI-22-I]|nr:hypothetical protein ALI22I_05215 [Saccharothrix sp. ALI-22-I]